MAVTEESRKTFEATWQAKAGFPDFLSEVNNQPIGERFMVTAFIFFLIGGVLALLMRVQLTVPENTFLGPEIYNQLFTMHGSTMMYLFAVPFIEGLAIALLPLMIGSRDLAFPRLSAFGYWTYLFGGILFYTSFIVGSVPDMGWFGYTPLSTSKYTGLGTDFWLLGLSLVEIGGITAAIEIVATILKFRAPGMAINRMPLFIWAMLVVGLMIIFAFTTLLTATVMLELDRSLGTCFFNAERGGNSLLWQHLFWFFGHPEVYIMFLPATGIVSAIVPVFAQRRMVGYSLVVVAIVVTGFLSFGLWVHHMFTTGLPELSLTFFTAASLMIAIASGIQVFAWIATLWGSRPPLMTPLLFVLGFVFIFVLGGLTGVMIAIVPFNWQVHDTYFIVAHFHYVLIGGVIFPLMGGLHYWVPKLTGRMLSRSLGIVSFWMTFIGFNLTFFPMHIMGFLGMPRRVYTYPAELEITAYNAVATAGSFILAAGFLVFAVNFWLSQRQGTQAGANPWHGDSLEWAADSPPPMYNFTRPPIVRSAHPLWDAEFLEEQDEQIAQISQALTYAPTEWRAMLVTDVLNARPQAIQWLPSSTYLPLAAAVGTLVAALGVLVQAYLWTALGAIFTAGIVVYWLWPKQSDLELLRHSELVRETGLPIFTTGSRAIGWWGMVGLLTTLGVILAVFLYSYFYLRLYSNGWPQDDLPLPRLLLPTVAYVLLPGAAVCQYLANQFLVAGVRWRIYAGFGLALLLGVGFIVLQSFELSRLPFAPQDNAYGSVFHVMSWYLLGMALVGLALSFAALLRIVQSEDPRDISLGLQMEVTGMYWYFLAVAAVLVFATLYLTPHVL